MKSSELNNMLIDVFPNLRERYEDEISWQEGGDTGSHIVYGDVFTPYLVECVKSNLREDARKAFAFLE